MSYPRENYLRQFRTDAKEIFEEEGIDAVIEFAAERILESYNNGKEASAKGERPTKPSEPKKQIRRFDKNRYNR